MAASRSEERVLEFARASDWARFLRAEHARSRGVWLRLAKKKSGRESIDYAMALEVALAWGWIDARKKSLDAESWLQRFTPRTARSVWSKINRDKAEALIAAGRMEAPGLAEVERAKRD